MPTEEELRALEEELAASAPSPGVRSQSTVTQKLGEAKESFSEARERLEATQGPPAPKGETTLGGSARSGALGLLRGGVTGIPILLGMAAEWLGDKVDEQIGPGGRKIAEAAMPAVGLLRGAEGTGDAARKLEERAADVIGGPSVGDTFVERAIGAGGEITGGIAAGGALAAPFRTAATMRGLPAMIPRTPAEMGRASLEAGKHATRVAPTRVGGATGLQGSRELVSEEFREEHPVLASGAELVGEGAGAGAGLAVRGGAKAVGATARVLGARRLTTDPVEAAIDLRRDAARARRDELGTKYQAINRVAEAEGITFPSAPLKEMVARIESSGIGKIKTFQKDVRNLPEQITLKQFREIQENVNDVISRRSKPGKRPKKPERRFLELNRAFDEALVIMGAGADPASDVGRAIRKTNKDWSAMRRQENVNLFLERAADSIVNPKTKSTNPRGLRVFLRKNEGEARALLGDGQFKRMQFLADNIESVPAEYARAIVGNIDDNRQAVLDLLTAGWHVSTAPIGSLIWKGRRITSVGRAAFSKLENDQRALLLVRAADDPDLAVKLEDLLSTKKPKDFRPAAKALGGASPAIVGERPERTTNPLPGGGIRG